MTERKLKLGEMLMNTYYLWFKKKKKDLMNLTAEKFGENQLIFGLQLANQYQIEN